MALQVFELSICESGHFIVIVDELEVLILSFLTDVWLVLWSLRELGLKPEGISIAAILRRFFYIWSKSCCFVALLAAREWALSSINLCRGIAASTLLSILFFDHLPHRPSYSGWICEKLAVVSGIGLWLFLFSLSKWMPACLGKWVLREALTVHFNSSLASRISCIIDSSHRRLWCVLCQLWHLLWWEVAHFRLRRSIWTLIPFLAYTTEHFKATDILYNIQLLLYFFK